MVINKKLDNFDKSCEVSPIKVLLYSLINVFVIFRIDILFLPGYMYILALVGLVIMLSRWRYFDIHTFRIMGMILCMFVYAAIVMAFNRSNDISYLKFIAAFFYKIMTAMFSYSLFKLLFGRNATLLLFMKTYVYSCLILLLSSLLLIVIEPLNRFWIGTVVSRNPHIDNGYVYRISLIGFTGFDELATYGISLFFSAFIINDKIRKKQKYAIHCIIFILLAVGGLLYGRTSIVPTTFAFISLLILIRGTKKAFKIILIFIITAAVCIIPILILSKYVTQVKYWVDWAFELIISLFGGNKSGVGSLDSLWSMFKFPTNPKTLFFGDGRYFDSEIIAYYMKIDVGFLRAIYYYGIIGMIANYALLCVMAASIIKLFKGDKYIKTILIAILLHIFIIEIKGVMFDSAIYYLAVLMFFGQDFKRDSYIRNRVLYAKLNGKVVYNQGG